MITITIIMTAAAMAPTVSRKILKCTARVTNESTDQLIMRSCNHLLRFLLIVSTAHPCYARGQNALR